MLTIGIKNGLELLNNPIGQGKVYFYTICFCFEN
jgi:hypothetical protein